MRAQSTRQRCPASSAILRSSALALVVCLSLPALEIPNGIAGISTANDDDPGGSVAIIASDGSALTLAEAISGDSCIVVLSGGRRRPASVTRRDPASSAVLLRIADLPADIRPLTVADSRRLQLMDPVWTAGNATAAIALDGVASISRGVISGLYDLPEGAPPARGRNGQILASWRGAAIETDAAINDGSQGGALLDDAGRLIGLTSRAQARERRLPLTVPLARILEGLALPAAMTAPVGGGEAWRRIVAGTAPSIGLVYMQRLRGPGNPDGIPRPPRAVADAPASDRDRLARWWEMHWQQQQVFYTDQPITALSLGDDLLLTASSNLHGEAERGRLLLPGGAIACSVVARDLPLDLALLRCERPHGLPAARFASAPPALGADVALLGRHREDSGWTATVGTISATERRRMQSRLAFLQTDARANYGSLGGPLIDRDGAVAGLCVLLGPSDERPWLINSGIAMAVDTTRIQRALPALRAGTSSEKPAILGMGVVLHRRSEKLVVAAVNADTGAERAGLQSGDELVEVAGVRATSPDAIARVLLKKKPGDRVTVNLLRSGKPMTLEVELTEFQP